VPDILSVITAADGSSPPFKLPITIKRDAPVLSMLPEVVTFPVVPCPGTVEFTSVIAADATPGKKMNKEKIAQKSKYNFLLKNLLTII
jgi:hypothetical protein